MLVILFRWIKWCPEDGLNEPNMLVILFRWIKCCPNDGIDLAFNNRIWALISIWYQMIAIHCGFPMIQELPQLVIWIRSYKQNKFSEPVLFCENKRPSAHSATKRAPCLIRKGASIWISSYQFRFWGHFCYIPWPPMPSPSVLYWSTCRYICR